MTASERGPGTGAGQDGPAPRPKRRISWIAIIPIAVFGVLALIFLIQLRWGDLSTAVQSVLIGRPAPTMTLEPLPGLVEAGVQLPGIDPASFIGEVTVVNVFASWCGPCREEHPYIEALAADERIRVVGINQRDDPGNALAFLARYGNPYDAVGVDPVSRASIEWGVYGVPETFFVDRNGIIRYKIIGQIFDGNFESQVLRHVEELVAETATTTPAAAAPAVTPPA